MFTSYRAHCKYDPFKCLENSLTTLKRALPTPHSLNFQVEASSQNTRFSCMCKICQPAGVTRLRTSIALCTYVQISEVYLLLNQIFSVLVAFNLKT